VRLRIGAAKFIFALGCIAMLLGPWAPDLETWALLTLGSLVLMGMAWVLIKWSTPATGENEHGAGDTSQPPDASSK
jgi:hypothetical protein